MLFIFMGLLANLVKLPGLGPGDPGSNPGNPIRLTLKTPFMIE